MAVEEVGLPVDDGQGVEDAASAESAPFYQFQFDGDPEPRVYKTKDELDKDFRESFFRQQDYTKKTQGLAETRKEYEKRVKAVEDRDLAIKSLEAQYRSFDNWLKNNPDRYEEVKRLMHGPDTPERAANKVKTYADQVNQEMKQRLEALEKKLTQDEEEKEREAVYAKLHGEFGDQFDRERLDREMERISGQGMPALLSIVWKGLNSGQSAQEIEEKVAAKIASKPRPTSVPGGSSKGSQGKKSFTSLDEVANSIDLNKIGD